MTPRIEGTLTLLDRQVIGRSTSFFQADLVSALDELSEMVRGRRILAIGAAGSIGVSTIRTLIRFEPASVHVIDHNENGLAEMVRSLRSGADGGRLPELLTLPFDYGGDPFRLWLSSQRAEYDHVLNFAALKHVRSEKDPLSILAMIETNVLHLDRLSQLLAECAAPERVFSVSTDKAANPSSMMGATKRLMEHALFLPTQPWADGTVVTSARFANVAFSNGSLLQAWQYRLAAGQPLACPDDTRRFFVSLEESGHLCTLASMLGSDRALLVPALEPERHLVLLSEVARRFLEFHGYEPLFTRDSHEALGRAREAAANRRWPVLLTPLDTGGEKPYEEFVGACETVHQSRFEALREVAYLPPADPASLGRLIEAALDILSAPNGAEVSGEFLKGLISDVEPAFADTHRASFKSLDERI